MEPNITQLNNLSSIQNPEKLKTKSFIFLVVIVQILSLALLTNQFLSRNNRFISLTLLVFVVLLLIYWAYKNISQKDIITRSTFYLSLFGWTAGLSFIFLVFMMPSFGLMGFALIIGVIIVMTISILIISIAYEIVRYIIYNKNSKANIVVLDNKVIKEDVSSASASEFFSIILFISSFLFLFDYLKLFINNYKYVKFLNNVNNINDYGLALLPLKDIFISILPILIYLLIIISFITFFCSFNNLKVSGIFMGISVLIFVILFISKIFAGSSPEIYYATVYQKGSANNGSAIDIVNTDKAIKLKDVNLCNNVNYYAYRNYCIKMISSK